MSTQLQGDESKNALHWYKSLMMVTIKVTASASKADGSKFEDNNMADASPKIGEGRPDPNSLGSIVLQSH